MRDKSRVEIFLWAASCSNLPSPSNILTKAFEKPSCQRQPHDQTLISQHLHQENRQNGDTSSAAQIHFGIRYSLDENKPRSTFGIVWVKRISLYEWHATHIFINVDPEETLISWNCLKVNMAVWGWEIFPWWTSCLGLCLIVLLHVACCWSLPSGPWVFVVERL